jgi:hypothetical protein
MITDVEIVRDYRPCWEPEQVYQALEGLQRLNQGPPSGLKDRRGQGRTPYATMVQVAQSRHIRQPDGSRIMLRVLSRNLSPSGISLLAPMFFEPESPEAKSPLIPATSVFYAGAPLQVGLKKLGGATLWLFATVIRDRVVQHDFLDVGLRFNARINVIEALEID